MGGRALNVTLTSHTGRKATIPLYIYEAALCWAGWTPTSFGRQPGHDRAIGLVRRLAHESRAASTEDRQQVARLLSIARKGSFSVDYDHPAPPSPKSPCRRYHPSETTNPQETHS